MIIAPPLAALDGIQHGFFTRRGLVTRAPRDIAARQNQRPIAALENHRRIAAALDLPRDHLIIPKQYHGDTTLTLEAIPRSTTTLPADALITARPRLGLAIETADCTPILFADSVAHLIGAAHAGWKGAVGGILDSVVAALLDHGASRENLVTVLGPCIQQDHYEVGTAFRDRVLRIRPEAEAFFQHQDPRPPRYHRPQRSWHFDLPGFIESRLLALGLPRPYQIRRCTYAEPSLFFSYRRQHHLLNPKAPIGRLVAAIRLR